MLYNRMEISLFLVWQIAAWTVLLEAFTNFCRFGFGLKSRNYKHLYHHLTFGLRIHHMYTGFLCTVLAFFLPSQFWSSAFLVAGLSMVLSDMAHHFLILPRFAGERDFP